MPWQKAATKNLVGKAIKKAIWITWEVQRRNIGISSALGIIQYTIDSDRPSLMRYIESIFKTIVILRREEPEVVFAQNPSTLLALLLILIKRFYMKMLILDSHNSGIFLLEGRYALLNKISCWIQKKADLTLVTNDGLRREIERNGGRACVLLDRIPKIDGSRSLALRPGWSVAYVCSFSKDEPFLKVIDAARSLQQSGVTIYFTGSYLGKVDINLLPANIMMMGFLADPDYWGLLETCDLVMDLTTRDDCLVCGAYEGIAAGKPLILSATKATMTVFNKGCVHVENNVASICDGILTSITNYADKVKEIKELRNDLERKWQVDIEKLKYETIGGSSVKL